MSIEFTDKQVILQLIKGDPALGFRLANPDYQNELVCRFMGFYNPDFRDLTYNGTIKEQLLSCHKIESIIRVAHDIAYGMEHGKYPDTIEKDTGRILKRGDPFVVSALSTYEFSIYEVIADMISRGFGNNVYHESSWLCFNVWMRENKAILAFMEQNNRIFKVRAFNAISTSRLRRFLVDEGYGSKNMTVPLLQ